MYVADITDTERICLRYLSRIDDKALALQCQIECLEVKTVVRIEERGNNGRLQAVVKQRDKAERAHAFHQNTVILAVTPVTGLYPTLFDQLRQSLLESTNDVGRRGKAPFAVSFLHRLPLVVDIQRKRAATPLQRISSERRAMMNPKPGTP